LAIELFEQANKWEGMFMDIDGLQARLAAGVESPRTQRLLRGLLVVLAGFLLLLFLWAAARRMRYPFEVEWIESNVLMSVLRVAHGQGLYVAPTLDFVPFLYAPLYLYLAAGLTKIVGVGNHGYMAMRLLSTLATLGSCAAIYFLVLTETRRRVAGIAAAGMFVGCYAVVGGFYDIGRVDSLFVFLLLLALLAQRRGHPVVAALLWVLTFQTKQTVLPLAVFILCAEWQRPRRLIAGAGTFLAVAGGSILLLNHATGGWYNFYLFHLSGGFPMVGRLIVLYLPQMVVQPVAVAWVVIVAAVLLTGVKLRSAGTMFYGFVSVALYGGTWYVEAHRGASMNAMMPVYAWTAVLFGVALARLLSWAEKIGSARLGLLALATAAMQLLALVYSPGRFVPPASSVAASQRFVEQLRALPGDVYVLNHSYDAILAGKQPHAEGEALGAVLDAKLGATSADLRAELDEAMRAHKYTAVVIDDVEPRDTAWHFERDYPLEESTGLSDLGYLTSQPNWFLLPCDVKPAVAEGLLRPDSVVASTGCDGVQEKR